MKMIENKPFSELTLGDSVTLERKVTEQDIVLFAAVSGDQNPVHLDSEYASTTPFGEQIAHGMFSGALISAALAMLMPGPGTIYLGQTMKFLRPVKIGDILTVRLTVQEKLPRRNRVVIGTEVLNQEGKAVVSGEATVQAPGEKASVPVKDLPPVTIG